jgi:hypothetical protein
MQMYGQMDPGAKMLLWGGLALGAIGLISQLTSDEEGGGIMPWIMMLLGGGAALGAAGQGGLFGEGVQSGIQGLMGKITGGEQPPAVPPEAAQAAMGQIQGAESPMDAITAMRQDGLTAAESGSMMQDPGTRAALMQMPEEEALAILAEARKDPAAAKTLAESQSMFAPGVMTTPVGEQHWSGRPGMGYTPEEATKFIDLAGR